MVPTVAPPATLDDLMRFDGKAELIGGRIVPIMPSGFWPGKVARRITRSLEDSGVRGEPVQDNVGYGFSTPLTSGRQSLSPDASLYTGPPPPPTDLGYIRDHAPDFAAEVRSEGDYGPAKDREYALKRKDYFFAGTQAVWDVDPIAKTVALYLAPDPIIPAAVFRVKDTAHAEPAVPGWRVAVADLFV
jgi:Uma2 family endonuclease